MAAEAVQQRVLMYDKSGEEHYNLISALHKSVRNSDPDAALYWLARMFAAGEDPLYLARRVVRMAVEDIGLAAPEALNLCLSAKEAIDFLGSPEGDLALAEAVVYLCLAPKSNSVYTAYGAVQAGDRAHAAGAGAAASAQCADAADEGAGLRQGISLRARRRGQRGGYGLPAGFAERGAATTSPRRKGARKLWRSGWRRFGRFARANTRRSRRRIDSGCKVARTQETPATLEHVARHNTLLGGLYALPIIADGSLPGRSSISFAERQRTLL